jgi:hypothetical protein
MSSGKITKPFELSEIFMFDTRTTSGGETFELDRKWTEAESNYCHVSAKSGGGSNFEMLSVVENGSDKYLILTATPDVSIDDPCITGLVVKLVSKDTAETILAEELEQISDFCMTIVDLSRHQRKQTIMDYFGAFSAT